MGFSRTFISRKDTKSSSRGTVKITGRVWTAEAITKFRHETLHQGVTDLVCDQDSITERQAEAAPWSTAQFYSKESIPCIMQIIYCVGFLLLFFEMLHDRKNETCQMLGTTLKALLEGIQIIQQVKWYKRRAAYHQYFSVKAFEAVCFIFKT